MPTPVTDPALLAQLNGTDQPAAVTDPALLAQLNAGQPQRGALDMLTGWTGPRYQTWPERLARGVAHSVWSGVTLPGDVATGKVAADSPEAIGRAMELAGVATPAAPRAALSATYRAGPPTTKELLTTGGKQIEGARTSDVALDPSALYTWGDVAKATLDKAGSSAENAPRVHAILDRTLKPAPEGATVTYDNLITLRRTLQGQAQNFSDPTEQLAASRAIKLLDEFLSNPPAAAVRAGDAEATAALYAKGRGNYAAGKRSEDVGEARKEAILSTGAANSGKNLGNRERQTFLSLAKSDKEISGFSPEEVQQIEQNIIMGTRPTNFFRNWSNRLGGGGGLGQAITAGMGAGAGSSIGGALTGEPFIGGIIGAAVPAAAGASARSLANKLTDRQIRILDEMVRSRSPMAEETALGPGAKSPLRQMSDTAVAKLLLESILTRQQQQ